MPDVIHVPSPREIYTAYKHKYVTYVPVFQRLVNFYRAVAFNDKTISGGHIELPPLYDVTFTPFDALFGGLTEVHFDFENRKLTCKTEPTPLFVSLVNPRPLAWRDLFLDTVLKHPLLFQMHTPEEPEYVYELQEPTTEGLKPVPVGMPRVGLHVYESFIVDDAEEPSWVKYSLSANWRKLNSLNDLKGKV